MSQTTTPLFEDWIEKLPTQTLTDEPKRDIVQEHKAHSENLYTEEEVRESYSFLLRTLLTSLVIQHKKRIVMLQEGLSVQ